jgi:aspartyl/asparaginyl beta-hydroxylase (cupin superfamily)
MTAAQIRAAAALRAGAFEEAEAILIEAVGQTPDAPELHLNLAAARRARGDTEGAMTAVDAALRRAPRHFHALLMRASLLDAKGDRRAAGAASGLAVSMAPPSELLDPATRRALERAQTLAKHHQEALAAELDALTGAWRGAGLRQTPRVGLFLDRLTGRRAVYRQQPVLYEFPELPSIEFYDPELFPWIPALDAAAPEIIREFLQVASGADRTELNEGFEPYIQYPDTAPLDQWAELNRSPQWSAFHLYKSGQPIAANMARCPKTVAALGRVGQPVMAIRAPNAMYSLLKPRTRIPPHTGVTNTRLVAHLPLLVPERCGFRVGSETRPWTVGRTWVFDDTIEHEAWNDSDQLRGVLIFDIWSPFLSESERLCVVQVMDALSRFTNPGFDL